MREEIVKAIRGKKRPPLARFSWASRQHQSDFTPSSVAFQIAVQRGFLRFFLGFLPLLSGIFFVNERKPLKAQDFLDFSG